MLLQRARYYRLDGQLEYSLGDLDRARELDPENLAISLQRGLTLSALRRDGEAEAELNRVLGRGVGGAAGFAERAKIRSRSGRVGLAISDLDAAIALQPGLDLFLERGRLQESDAKLDEAAKGYREGLDHVGDAVLLRRAAIRVEIERKRYDDALRMIDEQIDKGQLQTEWLLARAEVLEATGRAAEAEQARFEALARASQALRKRPTSANLVARAQAHLALGDVPAARRDLEQALRNSPQVSRARAMLSAIEAQPGE
ncbi:MAG: tetratricopeptide repeat protein [Deltaproteobacteria bacterium]|nr:tetratricopeptide repeat protein [Deltaproteobacteria bacterium]